MLQQFLGWINQITFFGIQKDDPQLTKFRKQVLNRTFFIVAFTTMILLLEGLFMDEYDAIWVPLFFMLVSLSMLTINYFNHFNISLFVLSFLFPAFFLGAIVLYGTALKLDYTISFFIVLILTLYDENQLRIIYIFFLSLLQAFSLYYTSNYESILAEYVNDFDSLIILTATTLGLFILVYQFIRESKKFQLHQQKLNEDLDKKNKVLQEIITEKEALNQKLREKSNDLQHANEFLESYTYITSHDLKTPVRNINSFSELLQKKLGKPTDQDIEDYLGYIRQGTLQINNILNGIIENAQSNRSSLQLEFFDSKLSIEAIRRERERYLEETKGQILFSGLPIVCADRIMIQKVFYNLIDNGLKYNKSSQPKVEITHRYSGSMHEFRVSDNGIGIQTEYREDIFKMFKKLHHSGQFTGSGVGLALCRKIVELHGGKIWLATSGDSGSIFIFTLPKKD